MKYHENKTKKSKLKQYIMRHSEASFQGFYPLPTLCYNSSTRFPELVRPLFPTLLVDYLRCPCDLSMQYFDTHCFLVSKM